MSSRCVLSQSPELIKEFIANSKHFLKIVAFRFDSADYAPLLIDKAQQGIDVEIITNPPDNVAKDELRATVESMYLNMQSKGVKLNLCVWEAGEPRLTNTSMSGKQSAGIGDKWYSLHLQLFVNESQMLITSRPLTAEHTTDIFYLSFDNYYVDLALKEFENIKRLFLLPEKINNLTVTGQAIKFLDEKMLADTISLFKETNRLNAKKYYVMKLPEADLKKGIYLSPFEGRMREFLYKFVDSSVNYLYFFIETLFDEELVGKIQQKIQNNPNVLVKIITSPPERIRQNSEKARDIVNALLSLGVQICFKNDIQAKFWINDKWLAIPSGDLNRMNLGHNKGQLYWKADTQLLLLDNDFVTISKMKDTFEQSFIPIDLGCTCAKEVDTLLRTMVKNSNLGGTKDASKYLARFKSALIIKTEQDVRFVIDLAIKLAMRFGKRKVEGIFMLMAITLYHVQRREHRLDELVEKLQSIDNENQIRNIVSNLEQTGLLLKSGDIYRININPDNLLGNSQKNLVDF